MTHHWEALGWTLVHFLWQGAAIALLYRIADLALVRSSPNARYVLALAALLSMFSVSLVTLAYEEAGTGPMPSFSAETAGNFAWTGAPVHAGMVPAAHASDAWPEGARSFVIRDIMPYLDLLWLGGVLCLSVRAFGGWFLLRRLRLSPLQPAPHTLRLHLDVLRRQLGIRHFVDLRLSSRIANPLTAGVFRPWIVLPIAALTSLSPEQVDVILSHELAHIRRSDFMWNMLQTVVETLFFFHPAVWWISRRAREERELCCDDVAVEKCSDPAIYASALLHLEQERKNQLRLAMALDGPPSRSGLRARILRILGDVEEKPRGFRPVSLAGVVAALLVALCPLPKVFASFRAVAPAPALLREAQPVVTPAVPRSLLPLVGSAPAQVSTPNQPAQQAQTQAPARSHADYIDQMRSAGYDVDLDKYIAMKVQGITPEYAADMSRLAGTKLSADNLIAMKVQGITPDYISAMRQDGYDAGPDKYIAMKVQGITPAYADAMAKIGFGKPTADQLIAMKVQGVTPEFAGKLHSEGIEASCFEDLVSYRIFNVTPEFIAAMKAAGFGSIPAKKLVELRVQGVTPEFARSVKARFPDASVNDLVQMRIFHIDDDFIASAQRHGFAPLTIQKLVKLRISGILDDADQAKENRP